MRAPLDSLTPCEREVLALLRRGLTNEEIAQRLGITLDGAKYHVSQILSKLGVATREEAAALAVGERRRWWAHWPLWAKIAGAATVAAAVAGLAVLAWGVLRTSGLAERTSGQPSPSTTTAPTVFGQFDDPYDFRGFATELARAIERQDGPWVIDHTLMGVDCDTVPMDLSDFCNWAPSGAKFRTFYISTVLQREGFPAETLPLGVGLGRPRDYFIGDYARFIGAFLSDVDAGQNDAFGGSAPKVYAIARRSEEFGGGCRAADVLVTGLVGCASAIVTKFIPDSGRNVYVFDAVFDGERWSIRHLSIGSDPQIVQQILDPIAGAQSRPPGSSRALLFDYWARWPLPGTASPTR